MRSPTCDRLTRVFNMAINLMVGRFDGCAGGLLNFSELLMKNDTVTINTTTTR